MDASAVLAYVKHETGESVVRPLMSDCAVSAVNYAEVLQTSVRAGISESELAERLGGLRIDVHPFSRDDAIAIGRMWSQTNRFGLSLGDRACLALARRLGSRAVTADQAWRRVANNYDILFIR